MSNTTIENPRNIGTISEAIEDYNLREDLMNHKKRGIAFAFEIEKEFRREGYNPSDRTSRVWRALGLAEAPLDHMLDSGQYSNPLEAYNASVDYILGYSDDISSIGAHHVAVSMLNEAREDLSSLDDLQLEGIRYIARQIGEIDSQIKKTTSPFELARLRKLEGDLEIQIFAVAVPQSERGPARQFNQIVNNMRKMIGKDNLLDSMDDFKEDSGVNHSVKGGRNWITFLGLAVGANFKNLTQDTVEFGLDKASEKLSKRS